MIILAELDGDLTAASSSESDRMVSDEDDVPLQNLIPSNTQHSPSEVSKKAGLDETVVKSRLNNSIVPKLPTDEVAQSCKDGNREKEKPRVTSIIMRPTWSAISKLADEARIKSSCVDSADKEEAMLNVRKQNGEAVIDDHSYTSTPWKTVRSLMFVAYFLHYLVFPGTMVYLLRQSEILNEIQK